jgi:hypothetical protein
MYQELSFQICTSCPIPFPSDYNFLVNGLRTFEFSFLNAIGAAAGQGIFWKVQWTSSAGVNEPVSTLPGFEFP